ncbi:hypothetical protein AB4Z38_23110 [Arthrobacter sp. 2RAF6]|uniref:hypothetical protein n=1 Tax=Arthrobacter sp. 2RAF6 TaxID=3233002 RepID=UPI003F90D102
MITAPDMATAPLDIAERTHLGRSYVFVANSPYPQLRDDPDCLDDFAGVMFVHGGLPVIPPAEVRAVEDTLPGPLSLCTRGSLPAEYLTCVSRDQLDCPSQRAEHQPTPTPSTV